MLPWLGMRATSFLPLWIVEVRVLVLLLLGLSLNEVRNVDECQLLMAKGWNNRSVGATLMNADSSRSHSIFTINIEMIAAMDAASQSNNSDHILAAKLNLVDLAGSERQSKTGWFTGCSIEY